MSNEFKIKSVKKMIYLGIIFDNSLKRETHKVYLSIKK